jgi:hypothetical protein
MSALRASGTITYADAATLLLPWFSLLSSHALTVVVWLCRDLRVSGTLGFVGMLDKLWPIVRRLRILTVLGRCMCLSVRLSRVLWSLSHHGCIAAPDGVVSGIPCGDLRFLPLRSPDLESLTIDGQVRVTPALLLRQEIQTDESPVQTTPEALEHLTHMTRLRRLRLTKSAVVSSTTSYTLEHTCVPNWPCAFGI